MDSPLDWTLRFVDQTLEWDFRIYQERRSAESLRSGLGSVIVSWLIGHLAVALLAPAQIWFTTVFFAALVYPVFVGTLVVARRARSSRDFARLQGLMILCDVVAASAIIVVAQVRLGMSLLALATMGFLMFDVAIATRRRTLQTAPLLVAVASAYQVTLIWQLRSGAIDSTAFWITSVMTWLGVQHAVMLARAAERGMREGFVQERVIEAQNEQIRNEKARSERLLRNVLPGAIADRLRDGPQGIADQFAEASILFADVSGFTSMSAGMSAAEVVAMLNEVFTEFDVLVEQRGLEKIKTIGDCYMVASGVPEPRPDHASALVGLALEMREIVESRSFAGRRLQFRFGINSGPVVAGVIGRHKFIYDLWGDTVNTASRMESAGQVGTVQITERTRELVGEDFACESRGPVEIKGKGQMEVWRVLGHRGRTVAPADVG